MSTAITDIKTLAEYEQENAQLRARLEALGAGDDNIFILPVEPVYPRGADPEVANPTTRSVGALIEPWAYHEAVSCAEDTGYGLDALRGRAKAAVDAAFEQSRLGGRDASGRQTFSKLPPFGPNVRVHVQVWITEDK